MSSLSQHQALSEPDVRRLSPTVLSDQKEQMKAHAVVKRTVVVLLESGCLLDPMVVPQ